MKTAIPRVNCKLEPSRSSPFALSGAIFPTSISNIFIADLVGYLFFIYRYTKSWQGEISRLFDSHAWFSKSQTFFTQAMKGGKKIHQNIASGSWKKLVEQKFLLINRSEGISHLFSCQEQKWIIFPSERHMRNVPRIQRKRNLMTFHFFLVFPWSASNSLFPYGAIIAALVSRFSLPDTQKKSDSKKKTRPYSSINYRTKKRQMAARALSFPLPLHDVTRQLFFLLSFCLQSVSLMRHEKENDDLSFPALKSTGWAENVQLMKWIRIISGTVPWKQKKGAVNGISL